MISFGGAYTRKQWGQGIRLALHPSGRGLVLRLLAMVLLAAWFFLLAVNYFQEGHLETPRLLRGFLTGAILVYWVGQPYFRAWRMANRPWQIKNNKPTLQGVVTDKGVTFNANGAWSHEDWSAYLRAFVREETVVLISNNGLLTILPRDFFANEGDWISFKQFVEFNVVAPI